MIEYDEQQAIIMMREALAPDDSAAYSDDDLLNLIDMIWDYYEQNGLLDIDFDDSDDDTDELAGLVEYARRMLKKDKGATIRPEHVEPLIRAELCYEDSLSEL